MSVYFPHSKYADHHIEKMYKTIEKHMLNNKKYIPIIGGDFNAELGPGKGTECKSCWQVHSKRKVTREVTG